MENLIVNLVYLSISLTVTIKVGALLHKHGTVFLIHHLQGLESLARSINHLLLVGFYLLNIGYILIVMNIHHFELNMGLDLLNSSSPLNFLSSHLGVVLLSLGIIHFVLLRVLVMWRPQITNNPSTNASNDQQGDE